MGRRSGSFLIGTCFALDVANCNIKKHVKPECQSAIRDHICDLKHLNQSQFVTGSPHAGALAST
jgi:hypothetical protein